jgi:outer membrane protein OmpA-like peptidoglycan-associated protein
VKFGLGSAVIMADQDTEAVLAGVLAIMSHPDIEKVRVVGHTDNRGGVAYNKDLSARRAAAVVKWLVARGVDSKRLVSVGHGVKQPLDDNATEAGRRKNRRVEFHIEESKP